MPLQIRRGTTTDRLTITPLIGELIYDTTTNSLYVGNGTTVGGTGVTAAINSDLNLGSFSLVSSSNGDIRLSPNGTGKVVISKDISLAGNITKTGVLNISPTTALTIGSTAAAIDGNVIITRNSYSNTYSDGFSFNQHHDNEGAVNFTFYRSRGTSIAETAVTQGDGLGRILFLGHDGTSRSPGAAISVSATDTPSAGNVASTIVFSVNDGSQFLSRVEIGASGELFVDTISGLRNTLLVVGNVEGDVTGSVFSDNSTRIIDGTSGEITAPSITASSFIKFAVYANPTARDAALTSGIVQAGMVVFLTDSTGSGGSPKLQVNTDSTTSGWIDL